ncbi:protein kinase-like domain, concanavalin A-like lectin/glucanase domain protein [Tanacetum coccineum]
MAFRGNTHDLGSFTEETREITDLHQILEEVLLTECGDGVVGIKKHRRDPSGDGVRDLVMASRRSRLNEDLESSTWRRYRFWVKQAVATASAHRNKGALENINIVRAASTKVWFCLSTTPFCYGLEILDSTLLDLLLEPTFYALGFTRLLLLGGVFLTSFTRTSCLGGTTVVDVSLVKGNMFPSIVKVHLVGIKKHRRDPSGDGVRDLVMASRRGRLNEDLESSTWRRQAYIDLESLINVMSKPHYNGIMNKGLESRQKQSNPSKNINFVGRVRGLKVFIGNFIYEYNFIILEDTTSIIDHHLGEVVFGKPFARKTGLIYDQEEGTVTFEKDIEKITFKMPHKMEAFNHIDFKDVNTDSMPPFVLESNDDHGKTYCSDSLTLGPEYREDESISKEIQHLMKLEREATRYKGEVT